MESRIIIAYLTLRFPQGPPWSLGIFWRADVLVRLPALEKAVEDDRPPINSQPPWRTLQDESEIHCRHRWTRINTDDTNQL